MATMSPEPVEQSLTQDERSLRLAKRQAILDAGGIAYRHRFDQSHHIADIIAAHRDLESGTSTDDAVSIAGRIVAIRDQGKACFMVVRDGTGDIQLFCRLNAMEEAAWADLKGLDVGDIVGVTGTILRTRRGELSVSPRKVELLTKACRPLPEKFHGLADKEARYRQRYVDLVVNRDSRAVFEKRFRIISAIRRYMESLGFLEVETPILHTIASGANARPFITHYNALNAEVYLRIAPELHLKRLLVGGFERVFEMNRSFRNEGMDYKHNPEFTTIEAYQAYTDVEGMKELCQGLFKAANAAVNDTEVLMYAGREVNIAGEWPSRSMTDLVSEVLDRHVDLDTPVEELRDLCAQHKIATQDSWGVGKLIFELYDELVEQTIVNPTFVCDYPVEVSPLAKKREDDPRLTERFELVIAGCEYANAFSELNDPVDQEARFAAQAAEKANGDVEAMGYDEDFVRALEYGMPPAGGIGIGIDRLVMFLTGQDSIRDVLLFPTMKPTSQENPLVHANSTQDAPELDAALDNMASVLGQKLEGMLNANEMPLIAPGAPDFSNVQIEPLFEDMVDFETFSKSDFRAVKVRECEAVKKSKKLLKFVLDDGTEEDRVILSGIHAYYEPEELVGKTLLAITNLPPRKMMGIDSCGMLISAVHHEGEDEQLHLIMLDPHIPAGAKMY